MVKLARMVVLGFFKVKTAMSCARRWLALVCVMIAGTAHGLSANFNFFNDNLRFRYLTSIDGLSNNTVYSIAQDAEGFIWIATSEGLNKYDGQTIKSYYKTDSPHALPGNFIKQVLVTSGGLLIVGTEKGACIYRKETDDFSQIKTNGFTLGNVAKLLELSTKEILIASTHGLFLVTPDFTVKQISNLFYRDMCEHKRGVIWGAALEENHLFSLDGEVIKRFRSSANTKNAIDFSAENTQCFYKHSDGRVWIGTMRNGIGYYNDYTGEFTALQLKEGLNPLEDNFVRTICEDSQGRLWIGTESGLYIYHVQTEQFLFYGRTFNAVYGGLNDKAIYSIYKSADQTMWVGTYFGGINYANPFSLGFTNVYGDGGISQLSGNAVSEMLETQHGDIWIGTEDGGISVYNPRSGKFTYIKHKKEDANSLSSNNVHALSQDENNDIWIGTFIGGLNKYNWGTKKIVQVPLPDGNPSRQQNVFAVKIDSKRRIWVGAISGLYLKHPPKAHFERFDDAAFRNNFIYHISEDNQGNIWACSYYNGIYKIDNNLQTQQYSTHSTPSILSDRVIYSFVDTHGLVWFGTQDGGLVKHDPGNNTFTCYTMRDGLPNNTVYAITEDRNGNIWFSTNKGLVAFDPSNPRFVHYSEQHGLPGNQFNFKSCLRSSDGLLFFGAVNGLTVFDPNNLNLGSHNTQIYFTDFKLFNTSLKIGEDDILQTHIDKQDKVVLKYAHNVFAIDYIGINYLMPKNNSYAYFLEGFDSKWNQVGNKTSATYTNLAPGNYVFRVKVINGEITGNEPERTLLITVLPPFWLSWWGMAFYMLVLLGVVFLYWRYNTQRQNTEIKLRMIQLEKEKNEAIGRHRMNFFTYISHEFKTPLTIVIATIDQLLEYKDVLPQLKDYGNLIRKNAHRLLFLINQLMEFRKIESDHSSLSLNKGDLVHFMQSVFDLFIPLMEKQQITGSFKCNLNSHVAYFDAEKLEKIVTNLIGNACNSFEKKGHIAVSLTIHPGNGGIGIGAPGHAAGGMTLEVIDDGVGIPQSKIDQVFNPFFTNNENNVYRSGIGLSLVKSLVGLLNGTIRISSIEKAGTTVTIELPLLHNPNPELMRSDEFIDSNTGLDSDKIALAVGDHQAADLGPIAHNGNARHELLIVEDNKDLSAFLAHHFSKAYKVTTAFDGQAALQLIEESQPDIVISDVMMPLMDGIQLCSAIKDRFETCHIPVVLLTAKSGNDSRIEGLDSGADAYIDKPFNLRELELTIRNILRTKQNIRNTFAKPEPGNNTTPLSGLHIKDRVFLEKLDNAIFAQLDNSDYSVELLCKDLLISRTLLHMKVKKITGLSTSEYIRNIKLNEAKKLLLTGMYTVSETSYKVGFTDPAYFSKSFKLFFNVSPSSLMTGQEP